MIRFTTNYSRTLLRRKMRPYCTQFHGWEVLSWTQYKYKTVSAIC